MKTALGKGLGALIPEKGKIGSVLELELDLIVPNKYQPRRVFRDTALMELAESIKENGVIQPVIVTKDTGNLFQLIAGERRWRAAKLAGLKKLPAILKDAAPAESLELALIENIQREDLNPLESAEAFQRLISDFNLTQDDVSRKIGKDRATVSNYLRILKLPADIKKWIAEGSLTLGHAKAILQVEDVNLQLEIARKIIKKGLSVREAEALCKKTSSKGKSSKSQSWKDPQIASLEDKLRQSLGTKVKLTHKGKKGGKIEIEYYSLDELDRLLELLMP
ncbi:MAG TPA: ParB/RepB/Spo0J family partition protein [Nitrospirae bacterium]|nr:ParB/RepB/Spo0J family partition protein [Nitrospirota bacterium]